MLLFSIIGLSLLLFSLSAVMINAQASSSSTSDSNSTSDETHATQMGICVVGAGGPCNGQ